MIAPVATPPRTPRQDEILDAALALVREEGWPGLTIRRLAERVGVTDPALYRHFATKGDIALGLADRMGAMLLGPVRGLAVDETLPDRERLARILEHHVDLILATDGLPVLLLSEASGAGDVRLAGRMGGIIGEYLRLLAGLVERVLARAPTPGELAATPEETAMLILGLPAVIAMRRRLLPGSGPAAADARRLARLMIDRLLPEPTPATSSSKVPRARSRRRALGEREEGR